MSLTASGGGACQGGLAAKAVRLASSGKGRAIRAGPWAVIAAACERDSRWGVVTLGALMTQLTTLGGSQRQGGWERWQTIWRSRLEGLSAGSWRRAGRGC